MDDTTGEIADRTILITGGAGYLGSQLIWDLAQDERFDGSTVRVLDNLERDTFHCFADLPQEGRFQFLEGDILDPAAVRRALRGVDIVVHLAALVKTPFSFDHPTWTRHVNQWGTARLVEEMADSGVPSLVLTSSASVYGPGEGHAENDECQPVGPYAKSKLEAEGIVREARQRGVESTILRFGTVYGDAPAIRFDAVPNRLAYLAAVGRAVTVHGDGQQERPVVHVRDGTAAILSTMDRWDDLGGNTYNVVGQNVSVMEVAETLEDIRPFLRLRHTAQDVMSRFSLTASGERLRAHDWTPEFEVRDGLEEILDRYGRFEPIQESVPSEFAP